MFNLIKKNFILIVIVFLALFLRIYKIESTPPSLNWDETSHAYNAYSILKTGRDEWGVRFPIIFRGFGDYKLPVYIYVTALFEAIFGLTTFTVRLPSVLTGVGTVIFTYFLVLELFKNQKSIIDNSKSIAALTSLLVAVEPWSLFLSRGAFEANLALFLFVSGIYFFIKFVNSNTTNYLLLSSCFFGLSVWTYNSYRVFTPILLFVLCILYRKEIIKAFIKDNTTVKLNSLLVLIFFIPMFYQLVVPSGQARFAAVGILNDAAISEINSNREKSHYNPIVERFLFNKVTYFSTNFIKNWISHYSGNFLYFEGGDNYQYNLRGHGLLYLINAPFLIYGLYFLIKKKDNKSILLLVWFFASPIPASLTHESPHTLRAITMLPIPMILTSIGIVTFWGKLKPFEKTPFHQLLLIFPFVLYGFLLYLSSSLFINAYLNDYSRYNSFAWQYGHKEVVNYIRENYSKYDKMIITKKYGEPHIFLLYNWPWDPKKYQNDTNLNRFFQTNWYWVDGFDKFYFVNDWEIKDRDREFELESKRVVDCNPLNNNCLLITSPDNVPNGWNKLETIYFLDGNKAFEIYDNR